MSVQAPPSLLAEVVHVAASATDADALLDEVAKRLLACADWVIADRLDDPDLILWVAGYDHTGPLPLVPLQADTPARRSSALSLGLLPRVLVAPRRMLRIGRDELHKLAAGPASYESQQAGRVLALGTEELLILALARRGQTLGVLSLGRRTSRFADADVNVLLDVAAQLGLTLEAFRLRATRDDVAAAVQTYLLPPLPVVAGLQLAARYEPAARGIDVGGDWYDGFQTECGFAVVVGDTAGHDVSAAVRMAELRNLLRAHAIDRRESPSAVLSRLDRSAFALNLGVMATCLFGHLEPLADDRWRLTWSSAGHLPPVLMRNGEAQLLETPPDLILGVDRDAVRQDHSVDLAEGDLVVLCTDGLIERRGLSLSDQLEALRLAVEDCTECTSDEICDRLISEFGGNPVDDMALFVVGIVSDPSKYVRV
jgi:serine phosphatase RsbU (regulator of sigma subunit)